MISRVKINIEIQIYLGKKVIFMKKNFFGKKTIVLLVFAIFFAISCGGKHPAVKNFEKEMSILQSGDIEKMPNVKSNEEFKKLNEDTFETLKNGYKKITYKVNKVETDKNTAKINVTMKSPDLTNLVQDALQKIMSTSPNEMAGKSQEELNKMGEKIMVDLIKEKLSSSNAKYREKTFDVIYKKDGSEWTIDPTENSEFFDMTTFGMLSTK